MNRVFLTCLLLAAFSGAPLCADPGEISGRTGRAEDAGVADRPERSGPQAGGDLPEIAGPSDLPALPALPPPTSEPSIAAWAGADPAKLRSGWRPMAGSMPVVARAVSGRDVLEMPCNFRSTEIERASWDLEVRLDLAAARGLEFLFHSPDPSPVSHFSLYFRSGGGWYAATFHPGSAEGWSRIAIDRESARVEGRPAGWGSVDAIRISAWRGSDADTRFYVADLAVRGAAAPVAVIRADAPAAAGREGAREIDTYCARVARYLGECGVAHVVIRDSDVNAKRLGPRKVAILPYNPSMSAAAAEALVSFVERGGKVVAFYHLPAALLPAVGLEAGEYVRQDRPGRFAEIRPLAGAPSGFPARVRQRSWNIQELRAVEGRSRAVAVWHDAEGESTGRAAVLLSPAGAFMTHVLLDDDEAAQRALLLSLVGHFHAGALAEALEYAVERAGRFGPYQGVREALGEIGRVAAESAGARERLERVRGRLGKARAMGAAGERIPEALDLAGEVRSELIDLYCSLQKPLAGEHRAFWCHSAFGVEGMTWDEAIRNLAENGFTAILPNMLWGGVAYYESDVLPVAPEVAARGDQIAQCVAACKRHGVECHVWKVNWNMSSRAPREFVAAMKKAGRTQVLFDGSEQERWLCPSHPENQRLEIDSMVEVAAKYDVDGIHFDYIRYPGSDACFCSGCRERFEAEIGRRVEGWPSAVRSDSALRRQWLDFRRARITSVVAAVAETVREKRPRVRISAAVFRNWPTDRDSIGQDWKLWCDRGYLDFVCPMDYTPSASLFESSVERQIEWTGRVPCYPGIGLSTWPDRADVARVIEQILITRRLGTGGFTIFNYSTIEAREVVPRCGLGITRAR